MLSSVYGLQIIEKNNRQGVLFYFSCYYNLINLFSKRTEKFCSTKISNMPEPTDLQTLSAEKVMKKVS